MAKSVGKFIGLGYRPLEGDVTADILNSEDQEFRHRAEKRLIDDRAARAKALKEAKAQQGLNRAKALDLFDTGSDSLNETIAEVVTIATNEYPKIFEILDDTTGKYSQQEKIKAKLKYDNILNLPENLKTMTNSVMGEYSNYQKLLSEGKIFRDETFENKFNQGYKGVSISLDDNGLPVSIFKSGTTDINQDGIIDARDIETMDSLNDVYARPQFQRNFDYDSMIKTHADKMVSAVNQTDNGITKTKVTGVEGDLLQNSVKRFLFNDDGTPTAPLLAFARQRNLDPNDLGNLEQIQRDYMNDVFMRTKRGKETEVDGRLAFDKTKDARDNDVKQIVVDFDNQLTKDDFVQKTLNKNAVQSKMISVEEGKVKFKNLGGENSKLNDGYVTGFALQKDNTVIVTGKALKTKNANVKVGNNTFTVSQAIKMADDGNAEAKTALDSYTVPNNYGKFIRKVSGTELGSFAAQAGFESVDALKTALKDANKTESTTDDFWSKQ